MKCLCLGSLLVLAVGCKGTLYQNISTPKGQVYVGMSPEMIHKVLGPPDQVGQGPYSCHYDTKFFGLMINSQNIVEWAWYIGAGDTVVAYLNGSQVVMLGLVKQ